MFPASPTYPHELGGPVRGCPKQLCQLCLQECPSADTGVGGGVPVNSFFGLANAAEHDRLGKGHKACPHFPDTPTPYCCPHPLTPSPTCLLQPSKTGMGKASGPHPFQEPGQKLCLFQKAELPVSLVPAGFNGCCQLLPRHSLFLSPFPWCFVPIWTLAGMWYAPGFLSPMFLMQLKFVES